MLGLNKGYFSMKYLGCPNTHKSKNKQNCVELIENLKEKLQSSKGKMLSYGGKEVLISSFYKVSYLYDFSYYSMSCPKLGPARDGYLKFNKDRKPPPTPRQIEHHSPIVG